MKCAVVLSMAYVTFIFPTQAYAQVFVDIFSGKGSNTNTDLTLSQSANDTNIRFSNVKWEDKSFKSPIYYGYGVGYFLRSKPWLGLRVQFLHHKAIARTDQNYPTDGILDGVQISRSIRLDETVQVFEVSHGLNTVIFSPIFRQGFKASNNFPQGKVQVYGGAGTGFTVIHPESKIRGVNYEPGYLLDFSAGEVFSGLKFNFRSRCAVLVEYKFVYSAINAPVAGGEASARFKSNHLVVGVGLSPF